MYHADGSGSRESEMYDEGDRYSSSEKTRFIGQVNNWAGLWDVSGDDPGALLWHAGFSLDQTVFEPAVDRALKKLVAGPGFEPGTSRL
jgi:hypothetical protein